MIVGKRAGVLGSTLLLAFCFAAGAQSATRAAVTVEHAWSPATPPNATVGAAYMQISATEADVLLGASSDAADRVEMHTTREENGAMRMRPIENLAIAAGERVEFKPGGRHFMLIGLHKPLAAGSTFRITLRFEKAGDIAVDVPVHAPGAAHEHH